VTVARDFEPETLICHYAEPDRSVFDREVLDPAGVQPRRVLEVHVTGAVIEMVRAGMGLAVLPLWALPGGRRESGLRILRVTNKGLFRTWHVAVLADQSARPPTSALVRLLLEELGGRGRRAEGANAIRPAIERGPWSPEEPARGVGLATSNADREESGGRSNNTLFLPREGEGTASGGISATRWARSWPVSSQTGSAWPRRSAWWRPSP